MPEGRRRRWGRGRVPVRLVAIVLGASWAAAVWWAQAALANTVLKVDAASGHDTGNCQASPCKTIAYAIAQGQSVPDLVTINVRPGMYTDDLALGANDSGLTIRGSGNGTNPATSTIIVGVPGAPTILTGAAGNATALTLNRLRIVNPSTDSDLAINALDSDLALNQVAVNVEGPSEGILDDQSVAIKGGSITLSNRSSTYALLEPTSLVISGTPITVDGLGTAILVGGTATVSDSPITVGSSAATDTAILGGTGPTTVSGSAITVDGIGGAVSGDAGAVTVTDSPIELDNPDGTSPAVVGDGAGAPVSISGASIDVKGDAEAVLTNGAPAAISNVTITLDNTSNSAPALVIDGNGSSLSQLTLSGAWGGPAIADAGSLQIADSSLTSGASPTQAFVLATDGSGSGWGDDMSVVRSTVHVRSTTQPVLSTSNMDMAIISSLLLGGNGVQFGAAGGSARALTVASSTIDAGVLGKRDAAPVQSLIARADNVPGSRAQVNVEGSILVEAPAAARAGTNGTSIVTCSRTEVPGTTQAPTATLGAVNCATGVAGNTFTASLAAIFAHPGQSYTLNPKWNGIDSVPATAISVPAPFTDSSTDLLGDPRVLDGLGTCEPGLRDKGAIELTGHAGVVPKPKISGPSNTKTHVKVTFTGSAPNIKPSVHVTFEWHSSDNANASGVHFSHTFKRAGKFKVSMMATGATGCIASTSKMVTVVKPTPTPQSKPVKRPRKPLR
jgi:hypothetical protein